MAEFLNVSEISSENNITKLFSQAPAPIAIYEGKELRYVFVNDAYSRIFNYRKIIGKTVREAFPELEGQPFYGILENVFETGDPYHGNEVPALLDINNDGALTTRYYNLVYTPYKNESGRIEGVMAFGHDVTDQVLARKKEKENDRRFKSIVEQSTNPILILKGEQLVLDVANDALFKLWNVGEEALGKPFLEILPEMKDQGFYDLLQDVYKNGKTHYGFETPGYFTRPGGEIELHYFNFSYQPYLDEDGKITGVLVLATDVTEQVLAKQQLAQSEINFHNMILQAPVAMGVLRGPQHVVEIANKGMYEIWGKTKEEILGKPIFEGLPEAKGQGFEQLLSHVYTTGERFIANEHHVLLPRNGKIETTYLNFVYEAYREGNGTISGVIAVASEITQHVLARQKIEYAEENARLAIDSADLGTYEINLATNQITTSPRFNAIWGINHLTDSRSEYAAAFHPDDLLIREAAHKEALRTGSLQFEARVVRKDGSIRWIRAKGKVLYDEAGTPARMLGVIQDISEQKQFAEELSKKVEERTKELKEANDRLERSNEDLEQFAYVASHDLQEPLRKIQTFNSLVQRQPDLNERSLAYIEKVSDAAERMSGLIKDLLEYSKLSQGKIHFQQTDLNKILKNVLSDYELLVNQKKATFSIDDLPTLEAIPLQMNQLFFNLVGNALKFTRRNISPFIRISASTLTNTEKEQHKDLNKNREYYHLKISDNGIGFNQDYAEKIFSIFQRLNEKSIYGGYGIGLALCRKIVTNHEGIIFAEGKAGEGASFNFILPCQQG